VHGYSFLRRPRVTLRFGAPISGSGIAAARSFSDEIAGQIAAMLPAPYRGVYALNGAGHARAD
jgi:hypothetical protein